MSPVIKSNSDCPAPVVGKLAALNIASFSEQAQRILIDARTDADQIAAASRLEAEQIRDEARAAGHAEGHAQGLVDGQAEGVERAFREASEKFTDQTKDLQTMLREIIEQVAAARDQLLLDARAELLEFALTIATKITHVQAAGDIAAAKGNLAAALQMANCAAKVQVKSCPEQLDHLREYASGFMDDMGMSGLVTFVPDPGLSRGDVVLQTPNGEVDGRIATQLDDIVRVLTGQEEDAA